MKMPAGLEPPLELLPTARMRSRRMREPVRTPMPRLLRIARSERRQGLLSRKMPMPSMDSTAPLRMVMFLSS
jgi:hypothetical protein